MRTYKYLKVLILFSKTIIKYAGIRRGWGGRFSDFSATVYTAVISNNGDNYGKLEF